MPTNLASALTQVDDSVAKAFADLGTLAESARHAQDSLQHAMREAQRAAALVDFDDKALQEFLTKCTMGIKLETGGCLPVHACSVRGNKVGNWRLSASQPSPYTWE